ncbi:MAG TPA: hydrogenase [Myxococcota bacterium]|nr:hydrogenase [Myxococcota bacterium]
MNALVDPILVLIMLLNFFVLATSRVRAVITASAAQGLLLGALPVLVQPHPGVVPVLMALGTMAVKAAVIPWMLLRALREAAIRREVEPLVGYIPSLFLCALGTALALLFARTLPLAAAHSASLIIPGAFATVLTGFLVLTTRRKALTQVAGYLILENGIFIMGLLLVEAMPLLVEIGVLLDLLVGIFVMGIIINHINREFSSLDTSHLSSLRE